jgi:hypothetical protein
MTIKQAASIILHRFFARRKKVRLHGMHNKQFQTLLQQSRSTAVRFRLNKQDAQLYPHDATVITPFDRHYVYHPAWAARVIKSIDPEVHIDISSTLHFCTLLSAFVPVKFYDYRPAPLVLSDLSSGQADLTALPFQNNSIESLSCMHTVEHIGLGRYGDPIDYDGDVKAMKELSRVLSKNGNLLFVVPVGNTSVIHFNGHRVYHPDIIKQLFHAEGLRLKEFVLIPEDEQDGGLVKDPTAALLEKQTYGCGCFWYTKD